MQEVMSYLVNWIWARKVVPQKNDHIFEHWSAEHRIPASGPIQTGFLISIPGPVVDPVPVGLLMGLVGKFGFPPKVRICFLLLLLYISFHWQIGAKTRPRGWDGVVQGEALSTWQWGKACAAPFSAHTKRGSGSWLHYCPPVIDMVGGGDLSGLNSNLARVPEIRALWGATAPRWSLV